MRFRIRAECLWRGAAAAVVMAGVLLTWAGSVIAETSIIVQSTTSTKNSGLYDHLLPQLKAATGITAKVVAVGTHARSISSPISDF